MKIILLILILSSIILSACKSKPKPAGIIPILKITESENYIRNLYIKYDNEKYNQWQALNSLLKNDIISTKKLGVIDCRGFDQKSKKLNLKNVFDYSILDKIYSWNVYETQQGKCIQLNVSISSSFFLSSFEASVLLSASEGYHFNKLGLKLPMLVYKKTILNNLQGLACGNTSLEYFENMTIHRNGCAEIIYYGSKKESMIFSPF